MKSLTIIKKLYLVLLCMFTGVFVSNANVNITGFTINPGYLDGGSISVKNTTAPTKFLFTLEFNRSLLPGGSATNWSDGACTISLIHRGANNVEREVSTPGPINITNADYGGGSFLTRYNSTAELPAGVTSGYVVIRLTYWNSDQNKTLTTYLENKIVNIKYTLPPRVPIYEWAGSQTGDYRLGMTEPGSPSKWTSRGIYFYAYNQQVPGTVPIYEFEGHVNDASGQPEFPENVTFYSTSNQTPPALPGLGSAWNTVTPKVLFYAFPTQGSGTLPVKIYSNPNRNNFLFMATGEISDYYSVIGIAFYAFPVAN